MNQIAEPRESQGNQKALVRRMLAAELQVEQSTLSDDFRWLDALGVEDAGNFLADLNSVFTRIPAGFSFGSGAELFPSHLGEVLLERIATMRGLIAYVEEHVKKGQP